MKERNRQRVIVRERVRERMRECERVWERNKEGEGERVGLNEREPLLRLIVFVGVDDDDVFADLFLPLFTDVGSVYKFIISRERRRFDSVVSWHPNENNQNKRKKNFRKFIKLIRST